MCFEDKDDMAILSNTPFQNVIINKVFYIIFFNSFIYFKKKLAIGYIASPPNLNSASKNKITG